MNVKTINAEAASKIDRFAAVNTIVSKYVLDMPHIQNSSRQEFSKSNEYWLIILTTILNNGFTNELLLAASFRKNLTRMQKVDGILMKLDFTQEEGLELARKIRPFLYLNIIENDGYHPLVEKRSSIHSYEADGVEIKTTVWKLTPAIEELINLKLLSLKDKAIGKATLLDDAPKPWTGNREGVMDEYRRPLSKAYIGDMPDEPLAVVNKLQAVRLAVSSSSIKQSLHRVSNLHKYKPNVKGLHSSVQKDELDKFESKTRAYQQISQYPIGTTGYLTQLIDYRGRVCYLNRSATPQGCSFEKAAFKFADKVAFGLGWERCLFWLHAGLAREFGFIDAGNGEDYTREEQAEYGKQISTTSRSHDEVVEYFKLFPPKQIKRGDSDLAWSIIQEIQAFNNHCLTSDPSLFMSGFVYQVDGKANVLQHMSALTRCGATAKACNVISSTGRPRDPYNMLYNAIVETLRHDVKVEYIQLKAELLTEVLKLGRNTFKVLMTYCYGASAGTIVSGFMAALSGTPAESREHSDCLYNIFELVALEEFPAIFSLKTFMHKVADPILTEQFGAEEPGGNRSGSPLTYTLDDKDVRMTWTSPSGFKVQHLHFEQEVIRTGFINISPDGDKDYDYRKMLTALSPNFVHSLDAAHLGKVVLAFDHNMVTIHDSYGCHLAYVDELLETIKVEFVKMYKEPLLNKFGKEINPNSQDFMRDPDFEIDEVLHSNYLFS